MNCVSNLMKLFSIFVFVIERYRPNLVSVTNICVYHHPQYHIAWISGAFLLLLLLIIIIIIVFTV
jgi:hypothetical protein